MDMKSRLYPSQAVARQERSENAKRIATRGEDFAARYLESKSYVIFARNFHAWRAGEIDIVALDPKGTIAFVEVKSRTLDEEVFGIPELGFEAVGYIKQRKIIAAAERFLEKGEHKNLHWRYDVIVVVFKKDKQPEITHVLNAFR